MRVIYMKQRAEHILRGIFLVLALPLALAFLLDERMSEIYRAIKNETEYISVKTNSGTQEMDLEEYALKLTAAQIPLGYDPEAVKAQMILVRTDLYRQIEETGKVASADYLTMEELERAGAAEKFLKAQQATDGKILTWEDKPVLASYHAVSGGSTRDGNEVLKSEDYPYLASKACPSDRDAPGAEQVVQIDSAWSAMEVAARDSAGYVLQIRIADEVMSGEEFRNLLGLPSADFEIETNAGGVFLKVHGVGHGLGMSQYTAQQMALSGKDYKEILSYFFPHTKIVRR